MRAKMIALLMMATVLGMVARSPVAAAQDSTGGAPSLVPTTPAASVGIGDNIYLTGAVITTPGEPTPRELSAYQSAVFVQSWLASAYFGTDIDGEPPPDLVVHQVDLSGSWDGAVGVWTVYYASDGTTPFIAFGKGPAPRPAGTPPDPPSNWFRPPQRVVDTFNGKGKLIQTTGTQPKDQGGETTDSGSSAGPIAAGVAAAAVVVGGSVWWFRRRRA